MPYQPTVWPEEAAPGSAARCEACELSRQRTRVIWGEGNPQARIVVLLDNPGAREDREGKEFVCGTRQMLQQAASESGFSPADLYVTYLLKCRPIRRYDKEKARSACAVHLMQQFASIKPQILFCMGNTVVQSVWSNPDAEVKHMRGRWHETALPGAIVPAAVTYHPLAVRRRPNLYSTFLADWQMVAERFVEINQ